MSIGDKILSYRNKLGLTQDELAARLQTTPQTIYKYEKGIIENIPLRSIVAMAEIFGVSPAELVGWNDEMPDAYELAMRAQQQTQQTADLKLSETEKDLIRKYRAKPEYRDAIHRLLGVTDFDTDAPSDRFYYPAYPSEDFHTPFSRGKVSTTPPTPYRVNKKDDDEK